MIEDIKKCLETIEYGFKDENGFNIYKDPKRWDDDFEEFYYLLSPDELLESRCGTCWEQVELERKLFNDEKYEVETYFICTYAVDASPCHTFLVYKESDRYYWFENSWYNYRGIHEYNSKKELLLDVKKKFIKDYEDLDGMTFVVRYERPPYHLKCSEMYDYMEHQELLHLNDENYYYCLSKDGRLLLAKDSESTKVSLEHSDYIIAFKDYKELNGYNTYKIDIDNERLEKHMLDIIIDNNIALIKFDDNIDIKEYLKECD